MFRLEESSPTLSDAKHGGVVRQDGRQQLVQEHND